MGLREVLRPLSALRPRRRPPLPAEARGALDLAPDVEVLAWSPLTGGGWAAATTDRLVARTPHGSLVDRPWADVHHAAWEADSGTVAVFWIGTQRVTPLEVGSESFLPEVIHERVRSSVVLAQDTPVPGGKRVWVAVRRGPDGQLIDQVVPARGVRLTDPDVAAVVEETRRHLREHVGE